jgi:hypothetical protein
MTKKRWIFLVSALVVVITPQAYVVPVLAGSRPDVGSGALLLTDPSAATNSPSTEWKLSDSDMDGGEIGRTWTGPRGSAIFMAVTRYSNPVLADFYYWAIDPTNDKGDGWSPPQAYTSVSADRSKTVCEVGASSSGCQRWEYWARYGQYLVRAGYDALGDEGIQMGTEEFNRYARYVDGLVSTQLS